MKDLAILKYMLEHNVQHAQELSETGARLADAGLVLAAEKIGCAVSHFNNANQCLEEAIKLAVSGGE